MREITLELPDALANTLDGQAASARTTPEAYLLSLLPRLLDEQAAKIARFHALIREGQESGPAIEVDDDYFDRLKERVRERYYAKHGRPADEAVSTSEVPTKKDVKKTVEAA